MGIGLQKLIELLVLALVNLVGMPISYFLRLRRVPLKRGVHPQEAVNRSRSARQAAVLWIDVDVLIVSGIAWSREFVTISVLWLVVNLIYVLSFGFRQVARVKKQNKHQPG